MNIDKLSLAELVKLNERVTAALPIARARELTAVRKELADLAASKGFTFSELLATSKPRRGASTKARKPSAKMRDPKGVIWAGRGRMPKGFDKAGATLI